MRQPFGQWLPDQPALLGATIAKNVLPYAEAYGQIKDLSAFTGAMNAACVGSVWARDSSGNFVNHAGSATQLMSLGSNLSWSNISKAGNYTGVTAWEWTKLGDRLIAVDINIDPQYYDMGSSSLYADLTGSPPKAAHIATVRNFVVLGNVNDGTARPDRLVWSGYNNSTLWTPSRSTQSDTRDLTGNGGDIQKIVPGQYGVVFQQNSIWVMTYAGPPTIFSLDEVEKGRGTQSPQSVCWHGGTIFYLGQDGFYRFRQGSEPIGAERVDRWFFREVDGNSLDEVRGVVDPVNRMTIWAFRTDNSLSYNNRLLFYNWAADKFSYAEVDTQVIATYLSTATDLDSLDTLEPSIDAATISLDSEIYKGGVLSLSAFDTAHKMGTFSGDAKAAEIETMELGEGGRHSIDVRPLVEGANATVTVARGTRNQLHANPTYTAYKAPNSRGLVNFRGNHRYSRFKVKITGGFDNAIGVDAEGVTGGQR